jgi:selenocysteine lyase/cysteine desulfurase
MSSSRRRFLGQLSGAALASAALPDALRAEGRTSGSSAEALAELGARLRARALRDEAYWHFVRDQFPVREDLVLMNAANLCPSPFPVQQRVFELTRDVDLDASFQNRAKFGSLAAASREALAGMMGCDADEVAIVRNTSSANATVVNGLDLGPGDEVVLWDQNHPTNNISWEVRARRAGFAVRRVSTPAFPESADALLEPFAEAIGARTRVVSFSHVSNVSGVALPAERLCRLAHERGAFTMIDGAQTFGAHHVDLHALGCDAYSGSAHKWLVGPKEAGLLYVRRDWHERLWATHVGVGYEQAEQGGALKFEVLGQRDDGAVAAVATAVRFHELIGFDEVEARVRQLAAAVKDRLAERIPGTVFHTPREPELSGGVVVFTLPGVPDQRAAYARMYEELGIAGAYQGAFDGVRLCPHIYNTMDQVDRAVEAAASLT